MSGKGKQGAPTRALGARAACGGARRARRATVAPAAWCEGSAGGRQSRARARVDRTVSATDPHHSGRRAKSRPGPGLWGDSSPPFFRRPARGPGIPSSHLPAERRSPQPASVALPSPAISRRRPPTAVLRDHGRPAPASGPAPRHRLGSLPPPLAAFQAAPGATPPPAAADLPCLASPCFGRTSALGPAHSSSLTNETCCPVLQPLETIG